MQESYGTLSETINGLKAAGYTLDFNIQNECLVCDEAPIVLTPEKFEIDKVYRFEGDSDPDDEAVVYAISSTTRNVKGILVNAYGIYSNGEADAIVQKLRRHKE